MIYCRAAIDTPERGRIYQKDFDAPTLFGALTQQWVSELVRQAVVAEGALYRAIVTPRYGDAPVEAVLVYVDPDIAAQPRSAWLSLDGASDPAQADAPLTCFTLELRFPDSGLIMRQNVPIEGLDSFWTNLLTALQRMGVLSAGDLYTLCLYVRDGDRANFHAEQVAPPLTADGDPLVELVAPGETEPDAPPPNFAVRALADFGALDVRADEPISPAELDALPDEDHTPEVQIVIDGATLAAVEAIARAEIAVEQGGMLVGQVYRSAGDSGYLVVVTGYLPAEQASASLVELRYTFASWQQQAAMLRERYPGQRIVGWYHTHLVAMALPSPSPEEEAPTTELFFSQDDCFLHRRFFAERWYVALVLGSQGGAAFFRWYGDRIGPNRHFHVSAPRPTGRAPHG